MIKAAGCRITAALIFIILLRISVYSQVASDNSTNKSAREPNAMFYAEYFPSIASYGIFLNLTSWPFWDDYYAGGSFSDLLPDKAGPDFDIFYGYGHVIETMSAAPDILSESEGWDEYPQAVDNIYLNGDFCFFNYYYIMFGVNFCQNRSAIETNFSTVLFNYDMTSYGLQFMLDKRFSSLAQWHMYTPSPYPEHGYSDTADASYNAAYNYGAGREDSFFTFSNDTQVYFHPAGEWVVYADLNEAALSESSPETAYKILSDVVGAYQVAGDYRLDYSAEIRYLSESGKTKTIKGSAAGKDMVFKISPGFRLGYNGGLTGNYDGETPVYLQSFYLSPMMAVSLNGSLLGVFTADVAFASSHTCSVVLGFDYGIISLGKPFRGLQVPIK